MSLTVGKDANEDEEAEAEEGSMVVSMDGSLPREAPANDDPADVVQASLELDSSALESTNEPSATELPNSVRVPCAEEEEEEEA